MPQVNSTVSDEINEMLEMVASATGESKSGLAREYIRRGVYQDVEGLNKVAAFRQQQAGKQNVAADPSTLERAIAILQNAGYTITPPGN